MKRQEYYWYKNAIFYEVYVRAFYDSNGDGHGDLLGLIDKLDYLKDLGVDCLWLLPIYPSPLKDDGYDIADYITILPTYGSIEDFKALLDSAHARDMRVITDLVLNHTSDQHPWFKAAQSDRFSPYRDYYVWSDTDQKYKDARIIFLDTEESNWAWNPEAGQYYWHRFYSSQPDLNYDNPAVQQEMLDVIRYWLDLGVDGFRVDAVPYLYEREGTNCENLPQTHEYLKRLRSFVSEQYPDSVLLCEANQWPEDVRAYFGENDEFHMGFHFPLMPRIFMALRQQNKQSLVWAIDHTPDIPKENQWCVFLRNHDELTLEMVSEDERQWMWNEYAPDPRMRLNLGIRRRLAPLLDNDRRKIELANSLLFSLPGTPIIYYGDEIGMGDNIWLPDRNGVRTPMQWNAAQNAGFSGANPDQLFAPVIDTGQYKYVHVNVENHRAAEDSLWNAVRRMIAVRKEMKVFGWGALKWVDTGNPAVLAYLTEYDEEHVLVINNLSDKIHTELFQLPSSCRQLIDLFTGEARSLNKNSALSLQLEPYQYCWFSF